MINIKVEFIKKHKQIDNYYYLDKYINFLLNYKLIDGEIYTEKHHILPISVFPEFKNDNWNIVELAYEDHKIVHLWLFKSINIRKYQRPLNWMVSDYKNKEEISNAAKIGWINLKSNKIRYRNWRMKKSESMKGLSSEEQRRRANLYWNNITDEEYLEFCNKMKSYWTEEKKNEKSEQMKGFYSNVENVEKKRKESKDRWDSLDETHRLKFKEKMTSINKDLDKRLDAGNKIKELWKNPNFLEKMKNRNKRPGTKIKLINKDGEEVIFMNMKDMIEKYNFSAYLIRKYRDTNNKISESDLKEENIMLLDYTIETIKN